ncbi:unnamed protein product, partial [Mesorhabditis belari]|uniref:Uncharacterized protein n=1 Tax=Mesorhabditis belari TaxID=2138241 RepID=A0AAF3J2C7_9BILA
MFFTDGLPSSDSESDFSVSGPRPKKAEASNLSAIFSSPKRPVERNEQKQAEASTSSATLSVKTVFSTSAHSFLMRNDSEEFEPYLMIGLAGILQQNVLRLILYTPDKKSIHQVALQRMMTTDDSSQISFAFPYVYFRNGTNFKQMSIIFSQTQIDEYLEFLIWFLIFTNETKSFQIDLGNGEFLIEIGDSVLVEVKHFTVEDACLKKTSEETKFRIRENSPKFENFQHLIGLRKGATVVLRTQSGEIVVLRVRKHKKASDESKSLQEPSEAKDLSETPEPTPVESHENSEPRELDNGNVEVGEAKELKPSVLERMARLGQPVLGMRNLIGKDELRSKNESTNREEEEEENEKISIVSSSKIELEEVKDLRDCEAEKAEKAETRETFERNERSLLNDYELVHRVIGVEMDRLEGRLEKRFHQISTRFEERVSFL